jgi:alkylation response protein AidB-like acyl-CoA dehydrogenase
MIAKGTMSVIAARSLPARPEPSELLQRAQAVAKLARARADRTEAERRISEEIIAEIRQADLLRVMQPQMFGGFEYNFDVFAEINVALSRGCGSTGWVYGLLASHQWLAGCFPLQAQEEFWADRTSVAAGAYAPAGQGTPVQGGWRFSGQWGFCSGCDNAQWLFLGAMIPQQEGPPTPGFIFAPAADCIIDDNWHTMGLGGTGSKNIIAKDVFVPTHRAVTFADLLAGTAPGAQVHANPIFRQSFLAVLPVTIVAPLLGMAESALAEFVDMVKVRTTRGAVAGGNRRMAELTTIQLRVAEAAACTEAARRVIFLNLAEAYEVVARGETIGLDMRLRNRRDQSFCVRLCVQAIDALFLASGGQGIFLSTPLQRAWRDAHAAASHVSLNWDAVGSMVGQYMLGLEPKGQY